MDPALLDNDKIDVNQVSEEMLALMEKQAREAELEYYGLSQPLEEIQEEDKEASEQYRTDNTKESEAEKEAARV